MGVHFVRDKKIEKWIQFKNSQWETAAWLDSVSYAEQKIKSYYLAFAHRLTKRIDIHLLLLSFQQNLPQGL